MGATQAMTRRSVSGAKGMCSEPDRSHAGHRQWSLEYAGRTA